MISNRVGLIGMSLGAIVVLNMACRTEAISVSISTNKADIRCLLSTVRCVLTILCSSLAAVSLSMAATY